MDATFPVLQRQLAALQQPSLDNRSPAPALLRAAVGCDVCLVLPTLFSVRCQRACRQVGSSQRQPDRQACGRQTLHLKP